MRLLELHWGNEEGIERLTDRDNFYVPAGAAAATSVGHEERTMRYKARYVLLNYNLIWALILSPFCCCTSWLPWQQQQQQHLEPSSVSGRNSLRLFANQTARTMISVNCVKRYATVSEWARIGRGRIPSNLGPPTACMGVWRMLPECELPIRLHLWVPYEYLFQPFLSSCWMVESVGRWLGVWVPNKIDGFIFLLLTRRAQSGILFYL